MLWRRRPNIRKLAHKHDVKRLVAALSYRDYWTDQLGRVYDLGAAVRRDAALALATVAAGVADGTDVGASPDRFDVGAALIRSLEDPSGEVRRAAATALGIRAEERAVSALADTALSSSPAPRYKASQVAAVKALVALDGPDTAETFVKVVVERTDDLEHAREILTRIIAKGGAETARSASAAATFALSRHERHVQDRAAEILTWLGPDSVSTLVSVVQQDGACIPAIRALGKLHALDSSEALVGLLSHDDAAVRQAAAAALGEISDPRVARRLLDTTGDSDYRVREAAIEAVKKLGPVATMPEVAAAGSDSPTPDHAQAAPILAPDRSFPRLIATSRLRLRPRRIVRFPAEPHESTSEPAEAAPVRSFPAEPHESTSELAEAAPVRSFPAEPHESTSELAEAAPVRSFPADLQEQAGENAGGWVYELDLSFRGTGSIPPERIVGAWRIDDNGSPTDEFVANPNYRPSSPKTSGWGRRVAIAALLMAIVIGGLLVLAVAPHKNAGKAGPAAPHPSSVAPSATHGTSTPAGSTAAGHRPSAHAPAASATPLHLEIVPTARVWVCLVAQQGRALVKGILDPGVVSSSFVAPAFRIFLGNGSVRLRINGQLHSVPSSSDPVAYSVTQRGVLALLSGATAPCA
jgi:HEAT repeat protein